MAEEKDKTEGLSLEKQIEVVKVAGDVNSRAMQGFTHWFQAEIGMLKCLLADMSEGIEEAREKVGLGKIKMSEESLAADRELQKATMMAQTMMQQAVERAIASGLMPEDTPMPRLVDEPDDTVRIDLADYADDENFDRMEKIVRAAMEEEGLPEEEVEKGVAQVKEAWEAGKDHVRVKADSEDCSCPRCRAQKQVFEESTLKGGTMNAKDRLL